MNDSTNKTVSVPPTLANVDPAPIARAPGNAPARVAVNNVGGIAVFVGYAPLDVAGPDGPNSGASRVLPGQERIFVLAPSQVLFGIAAGAGGVVTVDVSDALPISRADPRTRY